MDLAYAAAEMVISRAGAIAISELSTVGKPCIFVPLPTAAEDHQTHNAEALVKQNAAIHLKNSDAKEQLGKMAVELSKNEEQRKMLSANIKKMMVENSADRIADEILEMIKPEEANA
jgi:UDP-N-acetylglucosamine--N-acetylmuramyl-(pentapeptide) pyrophosphoryl-undecaprenol N-acetylglucosamine transferase